MVVSPLKKKKITLALQGGGSHGAFTWGILDRLLEEDALCIEGISGTSAGAVNGAIVATGLVTGGPATARNLLREFWKALSEFSAVFNPFESSLSGSSFAEQAFQGAVSLWRDMYTQLISPYDMNPTHYNPLRDLLKNRVNFEAIHSSQGIKLYVSATNVETNRIKIFTNEDLCLEALLASSCLPHIQPAVEWKGEYFWDGGFMGNPILEPLIYYCETRDLIIVPVNPITRPGVPKTTREIIDRMNEITFNSSLMREIRGIINIKNLMCNEENPYALLRLHSIQDEKFMLQFSASSKYDTTWNFLLKLHHGGRKAADRWLKNNAYLIGVESTIDASNWNIQNASIPGGRK